MCVSFQAYTRRRLWSDRDQIWHTHADSHRKGSGREKNSPLEERGHLGLEIDKCGKAAKLLDRSALNLAHIIMQIHIEKVAGEKKIPRWKKGGTWGGGGVRN